MGAPQVKSAAGLYHSYRTAMTDSIAVAVLFHEFDMRAQPVFCELSVIIDSR